MVSKMVTNTPAKKIITSRGEILQNWYTVLGGDTTSRTAWIMTAARDAWGMYQKTAVKAYIASSTTIAVMTPANGVRTPDFALIAVREKDPVAGYAPRKGPKRLLTPIATSS